MIEYLINFALTTASFLGFALGIAFVSPQIIKISNVLHLTDGKVTMRDVVSVCRKIALAVIIIGITIGITSPSNTYKHESVDVGEIQNRIKRQNNVDTSAVVVKDLSLQPDLDKAERDKRLDEMVDYTERHLDDD